MVVIHKRLLDFSNKKSIGKKNPTSKQELTQEEQLGNFTRKWHRQSITIQKVVQLERYLDHPSLNLQDIYASGKFTDEELDWLEEENILPWLSDGQIFSKHSSEPVGDGSNAALCNIVTVCPPGGSTISEMVVA